MDKINNVIILPICGFANRLRFINSCVHLFKQFNITPSICWKPSEECNINHQEIFKEIKGLEFVESIPENYVFFGHIHLGHVLNKINKLSKNYKIDTLVVTGSHEFRPSNVSELKFISEKKLFYKNIIWNEDIINKVQNIKEKLNITDNEYVTVHYRSIDKRFDSKDLENSNDINFNNNSPIKEFRRYIDLIDKTKIVLISNSKDVEIDNVLRICNDECNRNDKNSMIQSIIEFKIMCDSKLIIGSYFSSFSDEASFFNIIPKIIPIDISKVKVNISYHCSGISFTGGILCINYSASDIIDCIKFKN